MIRARAVAVNLKAATLNFGTVRRRLSSVTVPMTTTVLLLDFSDVLATILEIETGGLLIRLIKRRRSTTLLKDESVRPTERLAVEEVRAMRTELTSQEAVQLHQELEVDIVTLWRLAVSAANVMGLEIDT